MKALNCKIKILLAAILIAGSSLYGQEAKKEFRKEYNTDNSSVLVFDGKFSDVTLNTWDKNKAEFEVTITVEHSDKGKAEKLLDQIEVEFEQDGNEIIVQTKMDDDFSNMVQKAVKKLSIVIVANVPSNINLELENKFGTCSLGSFSGSAQIENSFGKMEIEQLSGSEISISAKQGDLSIGKIADAEVEISFGKFTVIDASNLSLEVNQGESIIGNVKNLSAEVNMGNCVVKMVDPSFESIDIELNSGNFTLGIDKNAGFSIDAEMKMGNLDIPRELGAMEKSHSGMHTNFQGKYGNGKSKISIEGKLGNVELKLK